MPLCRRSRSPEDAREVPHFNHVVTRPIPASAPRPTAGSFGGRVGSRPTSPREERGGESEARAAAGLQPRGWLKDCFRLLFRLEDASSSISS